MRPPKCDLCGSTTSRLDSSHICLDFSACDARRCAMQEPTQPPPSIKVTAVKVEGPPMVFNAVAIQFAKDGPPQPTDLNFIPRVFGKYASGAGGENTPRVIQIPNPQAPEETEPMYPDDLPPCEEEIPPTEPAPLIRKEEP